MRFNRGLILVFIMLITLTACSDKEPIKIGLVGTLSGPNSMIGISMRDGMLLKVDEVNDSGGINGKQIELNIQDDLNDMGKIIEINEQLIEDGIEIIFGHELSSKASPLFDVIKDEKIIVMSPTLKHKV